jgi:hypothetical protein
MNNLIEAGNALADEMQKIIDEAICCANDDQIANHEASLVAAWRRAVALLERAL